MNNFTPRAQQVLALARKEADRFNHNYVGTEHLLLGLIKLGQGVAVNVLQKMGLDLETVRMEVEKQVGTGPETKMVGQHPVHAAREEGARARRQGSEGAQSFLRRHRAHPARPAARRRRRRGARLEESRSRYRAHAQRDPQGTRSELHAAGIRAGAGRQERDRLGGRRTSRRRRCARSAATSRSSRRRASSIR